MGNQALYGEACCPGNKDNNDNDFNENAPQRRSRKQYIKGKQNKEDGDDDHLFIETKSDENKCSTYGNDPEDDLEKQKTKRSHEENKQGSINNREQQDEQQGIHLNIPENIRSNADDTMSIMESQRETVMVDGFSQIIGKESV